MLKIKAKKKRLSTIGKVQCENSKTPAIDNSLSFIYCCCCMHSLFFPPAFEMSMYAKLSGESKRKEEIGK